MRVCELIGTNAKVLSNLPPFCCYRELTDSSEGSTNDINSNNRELDLSGISLREGVTYDLTLVAVNNIGTSDDSNILEYTPQSATLCKINMYMYMYLYMYCGLD